VCVTGNDGAMVMRRYPIRCPSLASSRRVQLAGGAGGAKRAAAATAAVTRTCEAALSHHHHHGCGGSDSPLASVSIQTLDALPHGGKMKPFKYKPLGGVFTIGRPFDACRASPTVRPASSLSTSAPVQQQQQQQLNNSRPNQECQC
jgi:hypothetical protein